MSFLSGLGKILGTVGSVAAIPFTGGASMAALPAILGAGGAALGAIGQGKAMNRDAQFSGQLDLEKLLMERDAQAFNQQIARAQEGRTSGTDAWRKLLAAEHVGTPGARPNVSPYGVPQRQATEAELFGADQMKQEVMKRLQGGNPITLPAMRQPAVDPNLLKAGAFEQLAGYLSPALSVLGQARGPAAPQPTIGRLPTPLPPWYRPASPPLVHT